MNIARASSILIKLLWAYVPLSLLTPLLMYHWRDNGRLVVMDPASCYHVTEYADGDSLRMMYSHVVRQAAAAFLMRNPRGLDNPELFNLVFSGRALDEANRQVESEREQFRRFGMHQKPEVVSMRILRADRRRSFARAEGQLLRFYTDSTGTRRTFTADFELAVELAVNFDASTAGRYPFRVVNMKYSQHEHKEENPK